MTVKTDVINGKEYKLNKDGTPSLSIYISSRLSFVKEYILELEKYYTFTTVFSDAPECDLRIIPFAIGNINQQMSDIFYFNNLNLNFNVFSQKDLFEDNILNIKKILPNLNLIINEDKTELTKSIKSFIAKTSYGLKLESKKWNELRKEAMTRARNRCQICNKKHCKLVPHHRTYDNQGTDLEITDLVILCETCHTLFHNKREK